MRRLLVSLALAAVALPGAAFAQTVVFSFSQVGGTVVSTASGSIDLTGMTSLGPSTAAPFVDPNAGTAIAGTSGNITVYGGLNGPALFGADVTSTPNSSSGALFGFSGYDGVLLLPRNYVSLSAINASSTYNSRTFASMGLAQGSYTYFVGANTITLQIGEPVPEPTAWALMIGGFGVVGSALRRRRKTAARA